MFYPHDPEYNPAPPSIVHVLSPRGEESIEQIVDDLRIRRQKMRADIANLMKDLATLDRLIEAYDDIVET